MGYCSTRLPSQSSSDRHARLKRRNQAVKPVNNKNKIPRLQSNSGSIIATNTNDCRIITDSESDQAASSNEIVPGSYTKNINVPSCTITNANECSIITSVNNQYESLNNFANVGTQTETLSKVDDTPKNFVNAITQTDLTSATFNLIEINGQQLQTELLKLKDILKLYEVNLENFKNNDEKTRFFTGLSSYTIMESLFKSLEEYLPTCSKLTKFQIFYITLVRLRLDLSFRFLSYQFNVSHQLVSKYFYKTLFILYSRLKTLVYWPDRETLIKTMPSIFQEKFGEKITVIIDCFEIYFQKSGVPSASCSSWSNYKHDFTGKYLIGITPQGTISFISDGYGGRSSDKFITEDCGFLDYLQEGDIIMCDRGFLIKNAVENVGASLQIPAFTKGKSQLHPLELESTRKIGSLRIHVERIIGLLRIKYTILAKRKFPMSFVTKTSNNENDIAVIDQIILVCCALVNLCHNIVVKPSQN